MDSLKLGFFDSPIHEATAAVVTRVLEAHGITDIEFVTGESAALVQELRAGTIDLFISLWLPDIHGKIIQQNPSLKVIGTLYQPSVFFALPTIFQEKVPSVKQLLTTDIIHHKIVVYEALHLVAHQMVAEYGLLETGYQLCFASDEDIMAAYQEIVCLQKPELMLLSEPGMLIDSQKFYRLNDQKENLFQKQKASMILNSRWIEIFGNDLMNELEELTLGNQIVRFLEQAMREQGMDAEEAAEAWQRGKLVIRS